MLHHSNESDEHFARRLESFSDVVIGFSLAQLALSLNIPSQFSALRGNPTWFFAYLWTFSLVSYLWFEHHRMFARIFIPRTVPILLNFGWLATIGLMVYLVQVFIHFQNDLFAVRTIYEWYFGLYALNLLILSIIYALGLRERKPVSENVDLARLDDAAFRFAIAGIVVLLIVLGGRFMSTVWFFSMVPGSIGYGFLVAGIILRVRRSRALASDQNYRQ